MYYPCIEVTVAHIGDATIEDESSQDGKLYMQAFHDAATGIPGCMRGCRGRSDKYPGWVTHFLDYDTRKQHDVHKALINGPTPPVIQGLQGDTNVYVIHPNNNDRTKVYYAPHTVIVFFWGVKPDEFSKLAPDYTAAIAKSDSCTGYFFGEIEQPILSDPSGNSKIGSGIGIVVASGWRSKDQYERDINAPRVQKAWAAMDKACEKKDTWGMSLYVTENTGHLHSWRTPFPVKGRSDWLPAPGLI